MNFVLPFRKFANLFTLCYDVQVGTVVDSPADFYNNRVPRKQRKKTLVDELMADANFQRFLFFDFCLRSFDSSFFYWLRYNKRKYADIIQSKPKIPTSSKQTSHKLKKKK